MKKSYLYVPLVLLLAFVGIYVSHRSGHREREVAKAQAAAAELAAKNEAELAARKTAMADAIAAAEQRKVEREAKAAREAAEKEERQLAIDARDRAFRDQERATKQIERLKKELETERAALAKLETAHTAAAAEKAFLAEFVTKSRANVQALQSLINRLNQPAPAATVAAR